MAIDITEKQAIQYWADFCENVRKQTALMAGETEAMQR